MQFIGDFPFLNNLKSQSREYVFFKIYFRAKKNSSRISSLWGVILQKYFFLYLDRCMRWWVMTYSAIHFFQEYFALYQSRYILLHTYILILNKIISELHYYLLFSIFRYTYIIEFATDIYHSAKCICINYASLKIGITIFLWIHKQKRNSSFFSKHFCA